MQRSEVVTALDSVVRDGSVASCQTRTGVDTVVSDAAGLLGSLEALAQLENLAANR